MKLASYVKSACISTDVYKGKAVLNRSYGVLNPRFIDDRRGCFGMSLKYDGTLYVGMRGCKTLDEVMYCVETGMTKPFLGRSIKINKAIWEKYEELKENIDEVIKQENHGGDIIFTGHSLGGAVAQIAAMLHDKEGVGCVTFGSPYVGDIEYKKECDLKISNNARVVVKQDIIPKIRFNNELVHVGDEIILNSVSSASFPYNIYDHHTSINYLRCLREEEVGHVACDHV